MEAIVLVMAGHHTHAICLCECTFEESSYLFTYHGAIGNRYLRQMSHAYRARINMRAESDAPERLKLHDFISKRKTPGVSSKPAVRA